MNGFYQANRSRPDERFVTLSLCTFYSAVKVLRVSLARAPTLPQRLSVVKTNFPTFFQLKTEPDGLIPSCRSAVKRGGILLRKVSVSR